MHIKVKSRPPRRQTAFPKKLQLKFITAPDPKTFCSKIYSAGVFNLRHKPKNKFAQTQIYLVAKVLFMKNA